MQITFNTSLQHTATPGRCADTEEPERKPTVPQGPSHQQVRTASVYTIERHNRTHKANNNNHINGLTRNAYSAREKSNAINLMNEKEERLHTTPETATLHHRTKYMSQLGSAIASAPTYNPKANSAHQTIMMNHSRSASFSDIHPRASRNQMKRQTQQNKYSVQALHPSAAALEITGKRRHCTHAAETPSLSL
jgi:hypothetical protein